MTKQTCEFVVASEVFAGCPAAWEVFVESEPKCSWGDNNRTLVVPQTIIDGLEETDELCEQTEQTQQQVQQVLHRLRTLGATYVDLEN
jgi:hypothetical protein